MYTDLDSISIFWYFFVYFVITNYSRKYCFSFIAFAEVRIHFLASNVNRNVRPWKAFSENVLFPEYKYRNYLREFWEFKVGLSPSKKNFFFICFNDSPSKMMKNAFYFILKKALFIHKIFKFLSWLFGHVEKMAWWER